MNILLTGATGYIGQRLLPVLLENAGRFRKNQHGIASGESLDFWRVLIANEKERRLLLFAEMKLPGEAWLEFKIDDKNVLHQTATFRPLGLLGRFYWYAVWLFHGFVFKGMLKKIAES